MFYLIWMEMIWKHSLTYNDPVGCEMRAVLIEDTQLFLFLYVCICIYNQAPEDVHVQINSPFLETANRMQDLCIPTFSLMGKCVHGPL